MTRLAIGISHRFERTKFFKVGQWVKYIALLTQLTVARFPAPSTPTRAPFRSFFRGVFFFSSKISSFFGQQIQQKLENSTVSLTSGGFNFLTREQKTGARTSSVPLDTEKVRHPAHISTRWYHVPLSEKKNIFFECLQQKHQNGPSISATFIVFRIFLIGLQHR